MLIKDSATCVGLEQAINYIAKNSSNLFLKLGKLDRVVIVARKRVPKFWTLIKNCEFFKICSAVMHSIIIGCSSVIAKDLTICKQVEKQRRQPIIMIAIYEFSYLKRIDVCNVQAEEIVFSK